MSRAIPWIEIQVPQENISTKKVDNKLPPHKKNKKKTNQESMKMTFYIGMEKRRVVLLEKLSRPNQYPKNSLLHLKMLKITPKIREEKNRSQCQGKLCINSIYF